MPKPSKFTQKKRLAKHLAYKMVKVIPGSKIVTIAVEGIEAQAFDISNDGRIGYEPEHQKIFIDILSAGLQLRGGVIIRQLLPVKTEREINGIKLMIPKKNIYGVYLGAGKYLKLNAREVREACTQDYQTGAPIRPEPDCYYKDLPF